MFSVPLNPVSAFRRGLVGVLGLHDNRHSDNEDLMYHCKVHGPLGLLRKMRHYQQLVPYRISKFS